MITTIGLVMALVSLNLREFDAQTDTGFGAAFEQIHDMVIYEHSLPFIYKVKYRLDLNETKMDFCNGNQSDFCKLFNEFANITDEIQSFLRNESESQNLQWLFDLQQSNKSDRHKREIEIPNLLDFISDSFGLISNKQFYNFQRIKGKNEARLANASERIYKDLVVVRENLNEHIKNTQKQIAIISENFEKLSSATKMLQEHSEDHKIYNLLFVSVYKIFQNYFSIDYYRGILSHCKNHKIPISIVPVQQFQNDLKSKERVLQKYNKALVIPYDGDILKYYSMPFTNCYYTEEDIIIQINVPLKTEGYSWELYEFTPLPFMLHDDLCQLETEPLFLAYSNGNKPDVIKTITGTALKSCSIAEGTCYLDYFERNDNDPSLCAKTLFENNRTQSSEIRDNVFEQIKSVCFFKCEKPNDEPVVKRLRNSEYVIANVRTALKLYNRKTATSEDILANATAVNGAIRLKINCSQELRMHDESTGHAKILIPAEFPCPQTNQEFRYDVKQILPLQWVQLQQVAKDIENSRSYNFTNIQPILKEDLVLTKIVKPTLTTQEFKSHMRQYLSSGSSDHDTCFPNQSLFLAWLLVVTLTIFALAWKMIFIFRRVEIISQQAEALLLLNKAPNKDIKNLARQIKTKSVVES